MISTFFNVHNFIKAVDILLKFKINKIIADTFTTETLVCIFSTYMVVVVKNFHFELLLHEVLPLATTYLHYPLP